MAKVGLKLAYPRHFQQSLLLRNSVFLSSTGFFLPGTHLRRAMAMMRSWKKYYHVVAILTTILKDEY